MLWIEQNHHLHMLNVEKSHGCILSKKKRQWVDLVVSRWFFVFEHVSRTKKVFELEIEVGWKSKKKEKNCLNIVGFIAIIIMVIFSCDHVRIMNVAYDINVVLQCLNVAPASPDTFIYSFGQIIQLKSLTVFCLVSFFISTHRKTKPI